MRLVAHPMTHENPSLWGKVGIGIEIAIGF
jgi:hypothetical protein